MSVSGQWNSFYSKSSRPILMDLSDILPLQVMKKEHDNLGAIHIKRNNSLF